MLLTCGYLAAAVWFTLQAPAVPWVYEANLTLFASLRRTAAGGVRDAALTVLGGLALLAPLGFLLPLVAARAHARVLGSLLRTTAAAAAVAVGLAALQSTVPGGRFDVDDVLLNTVGAALAHLAVVPAVRRRIRSRHPAPAEPAAAPEPSEAEAEPPRRRTPRGVRFRGGGAGATVRR